jgi:hypothetical protein
MHRLEPRVSQVVIGPNPIQTEIWMHGTADGKMPLRDHRSSLNADLIDA